MMIAIEKSDLLQAAAVFADAFTRDPLYCHVLTDSTTRKDKLYHFFAEYLEVFSPAMEQYMVSSLGEGYMVIYDGDAPEILYNGEQKRLLEQIGQYSAVEQFYQKNYCILDLLAVRPEYRGAGVAGKMIRFFLQRCHSLGKKAVVEIFEPKNVAMYEHFGLVLRHTVPSAGGPTAYILEYEEK